MQRFAGAVSVIFVFAVKAIHLAVYVGRSPQLLDKDMLSIMREKKTQLGIRRKVTVKVCNRIYAPALYGVFRPVVLLPQKYLKMSAYDLEAIFAHELMHLKKHDILLGYVWLIVKAIHWFNPLAWIAYSRYLEDVELCRDSQAAAFMEDGAIHYGSALLNAARLAEFTSDAVLPAASLFKKKSALKERVVRMVKPQKHSKALSAISALVIVIAAMLCFTTACQPTPEKPAIIGKKPLSEQQENALYSGDPSNNNDQSSTEFSFPDKYQAVLGKDTLLTLFDATINAHLTENINVTRAVPAPLSYSEFKDIEASFFGDLPAYDSEAESVWTKSDIETEILKQQMQLNDSEIVESMNKEDAELFRKETEAYIKQLMELHEEAPETVSDASIEISEEDIKDYGRFYYKEPGTLQSKGGFVIAGMNTQDENAAKSAKLYVTISSGNHHAPKKDLTIDSEEAIRLADEGLEKLGVQDMQFYTNYVKKVSGENVHAIVYTKTYCGIPESYVQTNEFQTTMDDYDFLWLPEYIEVHVNNDGISMIEWNAPSKEGDIIIDNVQLMDFKDMMTIALKQLSLENITWQKDDEYLVGKKLLIEEIRLGMMKIKTGEGSSEYAFVPVWDFLGQCTYTYSQQPSGGYELDENMEYHQNDPNMSYLTINALDGSVIDRNKGY